MKQILDGMEMKMMKLEIEAKSGYNDGWTSKFYADELHKLSTRHAKLAGQAEDKHQNEVNSTRAALAEANPEMMFADGYDEALIGMDASECCAIYDYSKCLNLLVENDGMSREEAHEFMEFNVIGSYVGDFTPRFIHVYE